MFASCVYASWLSQRRADYRLSAQRAEDLQASVDTLSAKLAAAARAHDDTVEAWRAKHSATATELSVSICATRCDVSFSPLCDCGMCACRERVKEQLSTCKAVSVDSAVSLFARLT